VAPYPDIADYGFIGDCHSAALVSRDGSIDWCCLPRFDSGSVFGRLIGWERGGFCQIRPVGAGYESTRTYEGDSLVLSTRWTADTGELRLTDFFSMREGGATHPRRRLVRILDCLRGSADIRIEVVPRFDFGSIAPWLHRVADRSYVAVGGADALVISGDADFDECGPHDLATTVHVDAGTRVRLALTWYRPEHVDPAPPNPPSNDELDAELDETLTWWHDWAKSGRTAGKYQAEALRSAIVLKALSNAPTGAIVAAVTTSLPEDIGGSRNWDYRYSWVRDSQFTTRSLGDLGFEDEADGVRRFLERSAAGSADSLQIMYGPGGERRLFEWELTELEGYRGSAPVRVGNAASEQLQLDMYGHVLDLAWRWHVRGQSPDDDYWRFLHGVVDTAAERWREPDRGIWEVRSEPRHFVHSKVMCWVAVDRGLRLARDCMRQCPVRKWQKAAREIREAVEDEGMDRHGRHFVAAFGYQELDAALLLIPGFEFVAYSDDRMVRTVDAIAEQLDDGGLLRRYRHPDGLPGQEGVFIACTFWLAECYAHMGRTAEAEAAFARACATANDLCLYSEEFDVTHRVALGNFPQGLTHLSHLAAAVALANAPPGGISVDQGPTATASAARPRSQAKS
jgi:GH15 family glucan-1,4-alpha-glucosidase